MKDENQPELFNDLETDWEKEWKNMPEYVQDNKESVKSVVVHFETIEDMKSFAKLIEINITKNTKGVFFPAKKNSKKFYVDES